jgi:hypothetical protein
MSSKLDPNAEYRPYQVIDPRTWKARVIGITSQPLAMRLIQYISKGLQRKMAAAVNEWIIELDKQNLEPFMAELPKVRRRVYDGHDPARAPKMILLAGTRRSNSG